MKQSKYLIIFMILLISSNLFSQSAGLFGGKDESLISIEGSYDSETEEGGKTNTTYVGGSYFMNGNFEFTAGYQMAKLKFDDNSSWDYNINGFTFGGYYHIKESATLPFNIKFGGGYGTAKASGGLVDLSGISLESKATTITGGIYKEIAPNFVGFFNFGSVSSESIMSGGGISETDKDSFTVNSFGIGYRSGNVFAKPTIALVDGESSFDITVGFLLPQ